MAGSKKQKLDRLRKGMQQQNAWRAANQKTAEDSVTDFLVEMARPFVKKAVTAVFNWIRGWFR